MPGTITFRPIEANLTHNTDLIGKMNPYCAFIVGDSIFRGQICKKGGKHPHWEDSITIPYTNQNQVVVEVMDKDRFSRDDNIGSFMINLNEIQQGGSSSRWYPLTYKNKPAGEILLETSFSGEFGQGLGANRGVSGMSQTGLATGVAGGVAGVGAGSYAGSQYAQNQYSQQGQYSQENQYMQRNLSQEQSTLNQGFVESSTLNQPAVIEQETITTTQPAIIEQERITQTNLHHHHHDRHVFQEQQQVVEPRTFLKEVDVVETRPHLENIEVLEPQRVLKEVQYTQAVPVTKQIEVVEPHVVVKEVEVIEPRLVTKTIQVIENVPVKKQVEVIESVPRMQEVQTFEPQTFTKQVEVTDYVPVTKQVTVSEPVHLKKAVEFVEPVITTKTITKEIMEPVIVDEKITTSIGPASVVGESTTYVENQFSTMSITQEQRITRQKEWERLYNQGITEQQIEQQLGYGRQGLFESHHPLYQRHSFHGFNDHQRSEYERLRGTGLSDHLIEKQLGTSGLGMTGNTTGQYGTSSQYGTTSSQFGTTPGQFGTGAGQYAQGSQFTNLTNDQKLMRQQEYDRLRSSGLSEHEIERQLEQQGFGHKSALGNKLSNAEFKAEQALHGQHGSNYLNKKL